ncbi:MAG: hypothetical protein AB7G11_12670 [Phycisphaerales bacterium]
MLHRLVLLLAIAALAPTRPAGAQQILNLDATIHCFFSGQTLDLVLAPGDYDIAPIGLAAGGAFTAYNQFDGRITSCGPDGDACYEGWLVDYRYAFDGDPMGAWHGVNGTGYPFFLSPDIALAHASPARIHVVATTTFHFMLLGGWDPAHNVGGVSLRLQPTRCPADLNFDDTVSSQDFFNFLAAFFIGDADFNHSGQTDSQDFFDFLAAFFTPC